MSNGVIVGRFQSNGLHAGQRGLIDYVKARHDNVCIALGTSQLLTSYNDPLDFELRKHYIQFEYPDARIVEIQDHPSDEVWSENLDAIIDVAIDTSQPTTLYGGRDSFIPYYTGRFQHQELEQKMHLSASATRDVIRAQRLHSPDFLAGIIWASGYRYPTCYPTVDVAIFDSSCDRMLLGRKPYEDKFRLIGGFAEPNSLSPTYEDDAVREAKEETGLAIGRPTYLGSYLIDDWRYRKERDKIKSLLFVAKAKDTNAVPGDDIAECRWYLTSTIENAVKADEFVPQHKEMILAAARYGVASMMMQTV